MRRQGVIAVTLASLLLTPLSAGPADEQAPGEKYELKIRQRRKIVLKSEAEKQVAGRQTLTQDQIKNAPATFGDALNALTTLPGIMRTDVLFGTLIIRGAPDTANRYFVDGIPISRPQHFGGLHSVLSNDIVREANVYASAFPVAFGNATGAVLDFKTIDEVDKFGAVVDIGLISANTLIKAPWPGGSERPPGYWIASARIGYLPLVVPVVYKWMTGESLFALPQYYDYQLKGKIDLDDHGRHSLSLLAVGSYDVVKVLREATSRETSAIPEFGFISAGSGREISAHALGIYYDYRPSAQVSNQVMLFDTFVADSAAFKPSFPSSAPSENVANLPNQTCLKNTFSLMWLGGAARLGVGIEYSLYYIASRGNYVVTNYSLPPNNPARDTMLYFDERLMHHVPSGYIENRFQWGPVKFVPGVRADYLATNRTLAVGPRGTLSYTFPSETTIELAGGVYQSFPQVNMALLESYLYHGYAMSRSPDIVPEEAVHRSLAVIQKLKSWEFKIDGYYNNFYRHLDAFTNRTYDYGFRNSLSLQNMGGEFSLSKTADAGANGDFFGWASYTLSRSVEGNYLSYYDRPHVFKLVAGYLWGIHTWSVRVDLYSGFAYTPIVGADDYSSLGGGYYPRYGGVDSARYPFAHRISLRYSQERTYGWGSFKWYIEVINATNYAPVARQVFDYNQPYQPGVNPALTHYEPKIPIIPNFGVELRF